jgi:hypothetical protein
MYGPDLKHGGGGGGGGRGPAELKHAQQEGERGGVRM